MAKTQTKTDPISDALHAVTAGGSNPPELKAREPLAKTIERTLPPIGTFANVMPGVEVQKRPKRRLGIPRFRLGISGYLHNNFDVTPEHGTVLEDMKDPYYWSNVANQLRQGDSIRVLCEDMSFGADLCVLASDKTWAKVFVEGFYDYGSVAGSTPSRLMDGYEVRWTQLGQWAVLRKNTAGDPPLKENFQTEVDAYMWLTEYLRDQPVGK